ncbi:MAG: HAMP domain-containing histidine kinase [Deltaproteobacteria bacterium]|nr:HAMP domain-containing histidine kinase [Deltaproteobacteria bacterium]
MAGFRIGLFWKLCLSILASMACSLVIITVLYLGLTPHTPLRPHIKTALLHETQRIARLIEEGLAAGDSPVAVLERLHADDSASITLYGADGCVIARSLDYGITVPDCIPAEVIDTVAQQGWFLEVTYPRRVLSPVVFVPARRDGGRHCIVRCDYPVTKRFLRILPPWMIEGVVLLSLLICVLLLSRYLTRPLRHLTRAAREMGQGNFGRTITVASHDEVGELAQAMSSMSQRIANDYAARRELFADISHELRSPLARMLTDAEILLERPMGPADQEQHLRAICTEIENLNQLIGDLTILAKAELDEFDVAPAPHPLQDVVLQSVALFLPQIEEKRIRLLQTIPQDPGYVMLDPKRIGQVVSNLVANALRYTPEGGTLEIGINVRNGVAEVWLRDNGPGIPEDKLPFIFERFFRVDKSRSRTTGGSGLGLAIVKKFVEVHGGQVQVESTPGKGTCVSFTLPRSL